MAAMSVIQIANFFISFSFNVFDTAKVHEI
jgi:hypothetical protein